MIRGYVLCGGASTRMGRDKAFVAVGGRPLALRVADALLAGGADAVVLVGRKEQPLEALGLPVVHDLRSGHPLHGIEAGLRHAGEDAALFAPCDLPLLDGPSVARLVLTGPPAVATDGEHRHPLLCFLDARSLSTVQEVLARNGSAQDLASTCGAVALPPDALRNANRPEDLVSRRSEVR